MYLENGGTFLKIDAQGIENVVLATTESDY